MKPSENARNEEREQQAAYKGQDIGSQRIERRFPSGKLFTADFVEQDTVQYGFYEQYKHFITEIVKNERQVSIVIMNDIQFYIQNNLRHNIDACDKGDQPFFPEAEKKGDADFEENRENNPAGEGDQFPAIVIIFFSDENGIL